MDRFYVRPFGRDCLGNCSGWLVADRTQWRQQDYDVIESFVGNIYEPAQRAKAEADAHALAAELNEKETKT